MIKSRNSLVIAAGLAVCLTVVWFSGSSRGVSYEVRPEITLPEYRTDAARAIDAYEHVMYRFMNLTENNLGGINTQLKSIGEKLVLIDCKLTKLSTRMARIEKSLGIEKAKSRISEQRPAELTPEENPKENQNLR